MIKITEDLTDMLFFFNSIPAIESIQNIKRMDCESNGVYYLDVSGGDTSLSSKYDKKAIRDLYHTALRELLNYFEFDFKDRYVNV